MRVLGIDPGLASCGYALLDAQPARLGRLLEAGVITTPPHEEISVRLRTLYVEVRRLIAEYRPEAMAVEELFFSQNRTTAMAVAQARGVVLLAAHKLRVTSYTPLQVKLRIAGYGRAKKPQIEAMVQRLLGLRELPKPDDAADALAVALCFLLDAKSPLTRWRRAT